MEKDYTTKEYILGNCLVRYIIINDTQKVFLQLLPKDCAVSADEALRVDKKKSQFTYGYDRFYGALCHLHLSHHSQSPYANGCKLTNSYDDMRFESQEIIKNNNKTVIKTVITSDEGYKVVHNLIHYLNENGFEVECEFVNNTGKAVMLEMISSAALDGLSPYCDDDGSKNIKVHIFKSGWATEGKHMIYTLPELNLEKAWSSNFDSYKIGSRGSRPTEEYFPYAAVEDTEKNVMWGMQLYCNSTWQMEFSRMGIDISFTGGLGDYKYGNWSKRVENGESFTAPKALIACVKGDISDISDALLKMRNKDIDAYGEEGMPIIYNEWCTTWGKPSHEGNLKIAGKLKNTKVKYFVTDDGWFDGDIGDWNVKKEAFPKGMKAYTDDIREMGFVPGIWMEFECTGEKSEYFKSKYDGMHLKHNGNILVGQAGKGRKESFLDFRNPDTIKHLDEKVIRFLKDSGFGYIKVDYNANTGIGCDGAESPGEGLRQHLQGVKAFFQKIKEEIPDIIIENCASGGLRLEPSMMALAAMSSFSDAHECFEFPIIAANLQYIIPPRQSQIWCVMKPEFDKNRFSYTISAGFLGRLCWSGDMLGLSSEQMNEVYKAEEFYESVSDIIKYGKSEVYRTEEKYSFGNPVGTQAVLRYADGGNRALLVYHTFNNPQKITVPLKGKWEIEKMLYGGKVEVTNSVEISENREVFGNVILLKKMIKNCEDE